MYTLSDNELKLERYSPLIFRRYGNTPSIKTIMRLGVDKQAAQLIKDVMDCKVDLMNFESGYKRVMECYNYPSRLDVSLHVINDLINGFGVEYIPTKEDTYTISYGIEYINLGDTYTLTVCFFNNRFSICSWGDIIESHPKLFDRIKYNVTQ